MPASGVRVDPRKGMSDVTVDAISARAGLTHGSFHKQVATKQALLLEAIGAAVDQRRAANDGRRTVEPETTGTTETAEGNQA